MSAHEWNEFDRLSGKVARGNASKSDYIRFAELDKKAKHAENGRR